METPQHGRTPVRVIDELGGTDGLEPLDAYQGQVLDLIRSGLETGVDILDLSGTVADANDSLTRRLIGLAETDLGPPPRRYRWLALGSHGRREQVLSSDQDHAIAYELPAPGEDAAVHDYFTALAGFVVPALARAGLPLCTGGYMATNWCRPLEVFEQLFRGWIEEPRPQALIQAEVFLDVRGCHGDLPTDILDRILLGGGSRGPFRVQMASAAVAFRPPFGWFGRLRTSETVDLKLGGTAAIVLLARLYALTAGSTEHSTVPRLQAASAAGTLSPTSAASLIEAYRFLTDLRLRHQVEQVGEGLAADNRISLNWLTSEQRQRLRTALRLVRDMQSVTAMRFSTRSVT
ncbi:MAG TPA: putative nucleotidyltransferase substrate binding domain-containing protein [Nocardioidaceae bacterium]|nr:putative nucleotidyltransferase substrate binding domain-containing protein [Nocardioidaceae bacterium]